MGISISNDSTQFNLVSLLNKLNAQQTISMKRLSSGKKADDPSVAVAVAPFAQELAAVGAAQENGNRADKMLNVANGAMTEISSLVTSIQGLVVRSASSTGISDAERAANQMQIDSAIESIDRIVGATQFNGQRLIDGTQAVRYSMSSGDAAKIKDVRVYGRPTASESTTMSINVSAAATNASTSSTGWVNMTGGTATLSATTTMTISGELGTATIAIASGGTRANVLTAINSVTDQTGVVAAVSGAGGIKLTSQNTGADAFVSVQVLSGAANLVGKDIGKVSGTDATVTVNGMTAGVDGNKVNFVGSGYAVSFTLGDTSTGTRSLTVTDGGATFQLGTTDSSRATLSISNMASSALGEAGIGYLYQLKSGGTYSLSSDSAGAANVVKKVVSQVTNEAARVGGFQQYQVKSTLNALGVAQENLTAARSSIEDVDYAQESANLNRNKIMMEATTAFLGVLQSQSASVLSLLRL